MPSDAWLVLDKWSACTEAECSTQMFNGLSGIALSSELLHAAALAVFRYWRPSCMTAQVVTALVIHFLDHLPPPERGNHPTVSTLTLWWLEIWAGWATWGRRGG